MAGEREAEASEEDKVEGKVREDRPSPSCERCIEISAENVRAKKIGSQVGEHGTWERCTVDRMIQE